MADPHPVPMGRVLIVAGSDPVGGAGVQADIKTATALGTYATTAITAITVQDTRGVSSIHPVSEDIVAAQINTVLNDIGADAIKAGMLQSRAIIDALAHEIASQAASIPFVLDPVMVATSGDRLMESDATHALIKTLLPLATLITPNWAEAEILSGVPIKSIDDARHAATILQGLGPENILITGGHTPGPETLDLLVTTKAEEVYSAPKIETRNTRGTGCTLSTAIASHLANGSDLPEAVSRARAYVREAIRTAPGLGKGNGPLNHTHPCT